MLLFLFFILSASQLQLSIALNILSTSPFGVRIDYDKITKKEFDEIHHPILLCNILTEEDSESFTYSLMKNLKNELIEYDVRRDDQIESYECTLEEFINTVSDNSDHDDNMYLMNEAILDKLGKFTDKVSDILVCIRENKLFGYEDMFQHFPSNIKPSNALIIGGMGARSFLHADPYDWVGVNYLFEGEKLWTFIPPSKEVEEVLQARRNSPDAWDPEYSIAAGYVSDVDLYKTCSNYSIQSLGNTLSLLTHSLTHSIQSLVTNKDAVTSTINRKYITAAKQIGFSSPYVRLPMFESGNDAVDKSAVLGEKVIQLIQKPGDLVVIPPHWYHQGIPSRYSLTHSLTHSLTYSRI